VCLTSCNSVETWLVVSAALLATDLHIGAGQELVDLMDVNVDQLRVRVIRETVRANSSQGYAWMIAHKVKDARLLCRQINAFTFLRWQRLSAAPAHFVLAHARLCAGTGLVYRRRCPLQ